MSLGSTRPLLGLALLAAASLAFDGCTRSSQKTPPSASATPSASPPAGELSSVDADLVLAKVGETTIRLGDYAAALARMDRYERLRYQSADRRKQLLDEMINLELLAQEAVRNKLDEQPEVRLRLDEALREEVLRDVRSRVPSAEALPMPEVRSYYDSHRAEFKEPERRRAAAIVVEDESKARLLVEQAAKADPTGWGQLVRKHSRARTLDEQTPLELEGDLGIHSAPGQVQAAGPKLADEVRAALFEISKVGDVYPRPVRAGRHFYVLRMTGRTEARERSFAEAERSIRVRMVEQRMLDAERQLIEQLRKTYDLTVDERALARMQVPPPKGRENARDALDH